MYPVTPVIKINEPGLSATFSGAADIKGMIGRVFFLPLSLIGMGIDKDIGWRMEGGKEERKPSQLSRVPLILIYVLYKLGVLISPLGYDSSSVGLRFCLLGTRS
jgi:hypothetical protein